VAEAPSGTSDNTDDAAADLTRAIRRRRKDAGLSQPQLAKLIGYTRQYVSLAERIGQNLPSQELVQALDAALNAEGALFALRNQAKAEQRARTVLLQDDRHVTKSIQAVLSTRRRGATPCRRREVSTVSRYCI
jgi:transcriptional regulator with XRE-family HTH domain